MNKSEKNKFPGNINLLNHTLAAVKQVTFNRITGKCLL